MTAEEMWAAYQQINPDAGDSWTAWAFGAEPDNLARLVLDGIKTATASAYDAYICAEEPLPEAGSYSIILDSLGQAVCIIKTTRVTIQLFHAVSAEHAYKEGEGDRSLTFWRRVHQTLFTEWLAELGQTFTEDSQVVLEEFELIYSPSAER